MTLLGYHRGQCCLNLQFHNQPDHVRQSLPKTLERTPSHPTPMPLVAVSRPYIQPDQSFWATFDATPTVTSRYNELCRATDPVGCRVIVANANRTPNEQLPLEPSDVACRILSFFRDSRTQMDITDGFVSIASSVGTLSLVVLQPNVLLARQISRLSTQRRHGKSDGFATSPNGICFMCALADFYKLRPTSSGPLASKYLPGRATMATHCVCADSGE